MSGYPFVVRVYGLYYDPSRGLLVSDEFIHGKYITKLPGGGLEFGEGTLECLEREMMEETGHRFEVEAHFYTTDFFVESAFDKNAQVFSIYYLMKPAEELKMSFAEKQFEFAELKHEAQSFRFVKREQIGEETFTLPIDRKVGEMFAAWLNRQDQA
ncbi:MAG: NUDIX domain-containing protein [Bacteroidetes bacterium]|nr:NUDIX domain-containing protein [Bacteroidota bacterium]